jgi:hypothetical protein
MDMHAAYRETGSYRAAAEICGTTHKTVRRSVLEAQAVESGQLPAGAHNYESVRELVVERVARTKGRISAKRLLPVVQADGYIGSGRNFRRLVAEVKAEWKQQNHRGRRPGCGHRATWWSLTGARSDRSSSSALWSPGVVFASSISPTTWGPSRP